MKLRKCIVYIRTSSSRRQEYNRLCDVNKVKKKALVLNVKTRWDSTFAMLERALEMRCVLDSFLLMDPKMKV
jgi:hypothetical protein